MFALFFRCFRRTRKRTVAPTNLGKQESISRLVALLIVITTWSPHVHLREFDESPVRLDDRLRVSYGAQRHQGRRS